MADDAALDAVLLRICRIPDWDRAALGAVRLVVTDNRLVLRAPDGSLVKGELPKVRAFQEVETERLAAAAADERRQRDLRFPDADYVNPRRAETEKFIQEVVGGRIDALEAQVLELQLQVENLQSMDVAA